MKITACIFFLLTTIISAQDSTSTSEFGSLTINFIGLSSNEGQLLVALSNSEEDYKTRGKAWKAMSVSINELKAVCVFDSLKFW
jgi:uncharacterized protein (DUF2141 family)